MQDEVNEKTIALYIKTGKLTAEMLQRAMKKLLSQMKKQPNVPYEPSKSKSIMPIPQ